MTSSQPSFVLLYFQFILEIIPQNPSRTRKKSMDNFQIQETKKKSTMKWRASREKYKTFFGKK